MFAIELVQARPSSAAFAGRRPSVDADRSEQSSEKKRLKARRRVPRSTNFRPEGVTLSLPIADPRTTASLG